MTGRSYRLPVRKRIRARLPIFTARERDHVRGRSLALARAVADMLTLLSAAVVVLGGVQLGYSMGKIGWVRRTHDIRQVCEDPRVHKQHLDMSEVRDI
jgi:hypothetical protein